MRLITAESGTCNCPEPRDARGQEETEAAREEMGRGDRETERDTDTEGRSTSTVPVSQGWPREPAGLQQREGLQADSLCCFSEISMIFCHFFPGLRPGEKLGERSSCGLGPGQGCADCKHATGQVPRLTQVPPETTWRLQDLHHYSCESEEKNKKESQRRGEGMWGRGGCQVGRPEPRTWH